MGETAPRHETPMPDSERFIDLIEDLFAVGVSLGRFGQEWLPESSQRLRIFSMMISKLLPRDQEVYIERVLSVPNAASAEVTDETFEPTGHTVLSGNTVGGKFEPAAIFSILDEKVTQTTPKNNDINVYSALGADEVIELLMVLDSARVG